MRNACLHFFSSLCFCKVSLTLICSGLVQVEQDGNQDLQHIAALQHKKQELLQHTEYQHLT